VKLVLLYSPLDWNPEITWSSIYCPVLWDSFMDTLILHCHR